MPDTEFSIVTSPNPEEPAVFELTLRQAAEEQPDIIMATDPDADRLGVILRDHSGQYRLLTGNQIGAILVDYVLASRKANGTLPANGAVLIDTHTGFKFIGDQIRALRRVRIRFSSASRSPTATWAPPLCGIRTR